MHIGIYSGRPLVAALILAALIGAFFQGKPPHSTEQAQMQALRIDRNAPPKDLETLLDYQIKDYRTGNAKLDANITLQALFIAVTVLLILRRSDSLSVLGNAVPLSWLHVFVPVVIGYLWLAFGFILHDQIYGRLRGVEIMNVLHPATVNYQKAPFSRFRFH